jgi:RHS repeat-associated protein
VMYAVQSDHLNTPRRITSGSGQVMWQWAYSAFGETAPTTAAKRFAGPETVPTTGTTTATPVTFNLRYPGQYADAESGLFYNYFRSYSPTTGRYTQSDPIGLDGGWNRFGYVGANPLTFSDPTGLLTLESWWESSKAGFQSGMNDPWGEVGKAFQGIVPGEGAFVGALSRGLGGLKGCFVPRHLNVGSALTEAERALLRPIWEGKLPSSALSPAAREAISRVYEQTAMTEGQNAAVAAFNLARAAYLRGTGPNPGRTLIEYGKANGLPLPGKGGS